LEYFVRPTGGVVYIVVILFATGTGDRGFISRQGVGVLGVYRYIPMLLFVT
jgi:hypothetical protein